jgi:uncharacterized repeat protein (TIGR03806 family)
VLRDGRIARCILVCLGVCALPGLARGQTCTTGPRVPFAGHNLPLDSLPDPKPMTLVAVYPNLSLERPTQLAFAPDDSLRLVTEQTGRVRILPSDPNASTAGVYLDLTGEVLYDGNEAGLLNVVFDPGFAQNRRFYVSYVAVGSSCTDGDPCLKVVRYTQSGSNPQVADPASRVQVLEVLRPSTFHNSGMLAFGPDGMLYISSGEGGTLGGQDTSLLLGVILRIDVHGAPPYAIPPDNPFVGQVGKRAEIWHYGLRNPFRFSFDRLTGDLWIGDVGQAAWEEVDFAAAGVRGLNFGWSFCEGAHDAPEHTCSDIVSTPPLFEYPHGDTPGAGHVVTGGVVYRGDRLPELYGAYLYADFVNGTVWAYSPTTGVSTVLATATMPAGFAEDRLGEPYIVSLSGGIYRLDPTEGSGGQQFPTTLSSTGLFADTATLTPAPGLVEYDVVAPLWSDNALKRRWIALPGTQQIGFSHDDAWSYPVGTVFVKQFDLPTSASARRRVETRVFLRQVDRWVGYTYRWNAAQTDATLLTAALDEPFDVFVGGQTVQQSWHYPSPSECLGCHSSAAGRVLGARTFQLNRDFAYAGGSDNQLHALGSCLKLFDRPIAAPSFYGAYADPNDAGETLGARARSYLAANCSPCHQPGGTAPGGMDMRYRALLGGMNLIGVTPTEGTLGIAGAARVRVGSHAQSVLWARVASSDPALRMAKGTHVPDTAAVSLLGAWIDTGLAVIDSDGDGYADAVDNCPYEPNPTQSDGGGWQTTSPDGIGDACQCGSVDLSGAITPSDWTQLRTYLAGSSLGIGADADRRCSYPDSSGRASALDSAHLRRALLGAEGPPAQICRAATELTP